MLAGRRIFPTSLWLTSRTKFVQSIATGIEGLDCSKSSPYKLCTASPIKLYHERVSRTGSVFPIFRGYKLIDKPVQSLYGLVLQSRPHSIPVAIDCTNLYTTLYSTSILPLLLLQKKQAFLTLSRSETHLFQVDSGPKHVYFKLTGPVF